MQNVQNAQNYQYLYNESVRVFQNLHPYEMYPARTVSEPKTELAYSIGDRVKVRIEGKLFQGVIRAVDVDIFTTYIGVPYFVQIGKNVEEIAKADVTEFDLHNCFWVAENKQKWHRNYIIRKI